MTSEPVAIAPAEVEPVRLRIQLLHFSITRMIVNTNYRMLYPFLPAIARGLGVSTEAITLAITARSSLGLLSPLLGSLADLRGRKTAMLIGMTLFIAGMLLVTLSPTYLALFVSMLLAGATKIIFDPSMQAYIADRVKYEERGFAIALTEFGWSGAYLVGIPVVGWLMERGGWSAPFPLLLALAMLMIYVLWRSLPNIAPLHTSRPTFRQSLRLVLTHRPALAAMALSLLLSGSNELVGIVYGSWMENSFGLQLAALGAASIVIGVAELAGEGLVAIIADRLGKRRAVAFALLSYTLTCLLLPLTAGNLTTALIGLFLFYLSFEFTVVCMIPLLTELVPGARATMMSTNLVAVAMGRSLGALVGPALFVFGLQVNGIVGAIANVIGLTLLLIFIKE
jgi:predicted MFS family arabinose efflux permease